MALKIGIKASRATATQTSSQRRRTPQEVLRIAPLTDKSGVDNGGSYPMGMNGTLISTSG